MKASADGVAAAVIKIMVVTTAAAYPPLGRGVFLVDGAAKDVILPAPGAVFMSWSW